MPVGRENAGVQAPEQACLAAELQPGRPCLCLTPRGKRDRVVPHLGWFDNANVGERFAVADQTYDFWHFLMI